MPLGLPLDGFFRENKTREMLKTKYGKKAAPPVFRLQRCVGAWLSCSRPRRASAATCAASGSRYALGPFPTLDPDSLSFRLELEPLAVECGWITKGGATQ